MNQQESLGVPQGHAPPDLSEAIERLLAHPELLSSVASAIGIGKSAPVSEEISAREETVPAIGESAKPPSTTSPQALGESVAAIAPLLSALSGKGGTSKPDDPRTCLLRALKPYVSHGRAEAIDTIIHLSRISELLKNTDLTRRG